MSRFRRWPLAVTCLGLGLAGAIVANQRLTGQPVPPAPPAPRELTSFSPIVKRVVPAVVSIEGTARPIPRNNQQEAEPEYGSGVIIDPSGVVLTNNHVVQGTDSVEVTLAQGRKFLCRDIRRDPHSDLAIIKLPAGGPYPFLEFADSDVVEVGDRVLAVGSPFGLTGSVTHGIISGKSRNNLRLNDQEDFIQTDAAVNPGSSGGPLVDLEGRIVGLTAAIKTKSGGSQGVALAVSSKLAKAVSQQLLKDGVVRRAYLGAGVKDLDAAVAARLGVKPDGGALVARVHPNSPAAKVGLVAGDVITDIAGQPVRDARAVQRIIIGLTPNQAVEVGAVRGGKPLAAKVVMEEQPADYGAALPTPRPGQPTAPGGVTPLQDLGLAVADLTGELAGRLGFAVGTKGAVVVVVTREGIAERSGVRAWQVVVKVDKTAVTSADTFREALSAADRGKGALLQVLRPNGEIDFVVLRLQ
jgi:serine protease Do